MFLAARSGISIPASLLGGCALILTSLLARQLVASDETLPSANEIVERYDQALGGQEAIRRHTSSTMRGTLERHEPSGVVTAGFVYYAASPYMRVEKVTLPNNLGENRNGFDGQTAWSFDTRSGAKIYFGDDLQSQKRDADFYYPIDELTWFKSMQTMSTEDFEGHACYHLHGVNNWDKSNDHFYDRQTGLLTAYEFETDLGLTHEIFSDYARIDGVLVPLKETFKYKAKDGSWTVFQTLTYSSWTFNDVDPSVFTPPQAVRDLVVKAKAAPAS